jgi:DNA mismatch repair protein MutS
VVRRAREHLFRLEHESELHAERGHPQLGLFAEAERRKQDAESLRLQALSEEIELINLDELRPIEALNILSRLKNRFNGED